MRFRKKCLPAYFQRRERSQNFSYLGNAWNLGGHDGNSPLNQPFGTTLFSDAFVGTNGVNWQTNFDASKWTGISYIVGASPQCHFNGLPGINGDAGCGVRAFSVPITFNVDKAHAIILNTCSLFTRRTDGQASIGMGMENNGVSNIGVCQSSWNGGLVLDHTGTNFTFNLAGDTTGGVSGIQYDGSNVTLKATVSAWTGTNRTMKVYLNGVQVYSNVTTTRGVGANNRVVLNLGAGGSGTPTWSMGKLTFTGFAT